MPGAVYKKIELVGTSGNSFSEAAAAAVGALPPRALRRTPRCTPAPRVSTVSTRWRSPKG